jgi:hypothetical protein
VDCSLRWPTIRLGERHVFQFGAEGGATAREFYQGSARVADFLHQQGSARDRWLPPAPDGDSPEAEWGFAGSLAEDVAAAAAERHLEVQRLRFGHPEDASPLVAELFRNWYASQGLPAGRLLVSSFLLMDPLLAIRTGSVPYWALFGTRPSLDRLAGYLSGTAGYDDIRLSIFPHGTESIGLPSISDWQAVLGHARHLGQLLAVEPSHYPRHFRALSGFHRELSRLPRIPEAPPLDWGAAQQFLASQSAAGAAGTGTRIGWQGG